VASFDPITAALEVGGLLIDRLWPDPTKAGEAKLELAKMAHNGELARLTAETELAKGQLQINQEEARSGSLFVSGWRPAVGWVCGLAFAYAAVIEPMARFAASVGFGYSGSFPVIDTALTMQVLFGILGLGALRTREKEKQVASK
jgi:hypothetical protein